MAEGRNEQKIAQFAAELETLILTKFGEMLDSEGEGQEAAVVHSMVVAATVEQASGQTRGFWTVFGSNPYELIGLTQSVLRDLEDAEQEVEFHEEG